MNTINVKYKNKKVSFYTPNNITIRRANSVFTKEPITIDWIDQIQENEVVFDIGANVGTYTCMAAVGRQARVYAFEPEAQNYAMLNNNLKLNGITDIATAYCTGALDYNGQGILNIGQRWKKDVLGGSGHSVDEERTYSLEPMEVLYRQGTNVLRLDTFCDQMNVTPHHLKIDVDGLEHRVVDGALVTLSKAKTVIIELDTKLLQHMAVVDIMKDFGYNIDDAQVKAALRSHGTGEHLFFR